jgi:predicted  nucleic acid-binding Zn-ribbon protein
MSTIKLLASLQAIDLELDSDRRKFAENKQAMQPSPELKRQAALVKEAEASLEHWRKERRLRDEKVEALAKKIGGSEKKLYGGGIRDPREQVAMQQNIEALKRHQETLEEAALEALLEQEEAEQALVSAQRRFEEMKKAWSEKKASLEKEQERLVQHARILKAKREQLVATLSPADVAQYESMRKKHGGVAIARLEGRNCGGCGASLPTAVVQKVREEQAIRCPICGRLLYD